MPAFAKAVVGFYRDLSGHIFSAPGRCQQCTQGCTRLRCGLWNHSQGSATRCVTLGELFNFPGLSVLIQTPEAKVLPVGILRVEELCGTQWSCPWGASEFSFGASHGSPGLLHNNMKLLKTYFSMSL